MKKQSLYIFLTTAILIFFNNAFADGLPDPYHLTRASPTTKIIVPGEAPPPPTTHDFEATPDTGNIVLGSAAGMVACMAILHNKMEHPGWACSALVAVAEATRKNNNFGASLVGIGIGTGISYPLFKETWHF